MTKCEVMCFWPIWFKSTEKLVNVHNESICQFYSLVFQSMSVCLSFHLFVSLRPSFVCPSFCLSICPSVCPSVCQSSSIIHLSILLSVSLHPSFICLSFCLSLSVCPVCLASCLQCIFWPIPFLIAPAGNHCSCIGYFFC